MSTTILVGDALAMLGTLADESVQCVVCSPPYYGLRAYAAAPVIWRRSMTKLCTEEDVHHAWGDEKLMQRTGGTGSSTLSIHPGHISDEAVAAKVERATINTKSVFCSRCGAWRGQLGLEPTYALYIEHMLAIFAEIYRVLRKDGTCWVNMGDCFATSAGSVGRHPGGGKRGQRWAIGQGRAWQDHKGVRPAMGKHEYVGESAGIGPMTQPNRMPQPGLKRKNLMMMPARLAIALQDAGWILRQNVIWSKPAPMPESVYDRPTTSHEHLFLFAKSSTTKLWVHQDKGMVGRVSKRPEPDWRWAHRTKKINGRPIERSTPPPKRQAKQWRRSNLWRGLDYYYDAEAIMEPSSPNSHARAARARSKDHKWANGGPGHAPQQIALGSPSAGRMLAGRNDDTVRARMGRGAGWRKQTGPNSRASANDSYDAHLGTAYLVPMRNKRSVWTVGSEPFREAHFAVFPAALIEPCILAGAPVGGLVLDPFLGAGTTALVCSRLQRDCIGIELSEKYARMAERRIRDDHGQLLGTAAGIELDTSQLHLFEEAAE